MMKKLKSKSKRSMIMQGCVIIFMITGFISCKKTTTVKPGNISNITFEVEYAVDNLPLLFDSIQYENAAGNKYSVSKLEYFISNIVFHGTNADISLPTVQYLNASTANSNLFRITGVPHGKYSSVSFFIGLDSVSNKTDLLPHTLDNDQMFWPVQMGGGYHFLKLEGHYIDSTSILGYTFHLGKNPNQVKVNLTEAMDLKQDEHKIILKMNINEWFANPHKYNLVTDGAYTMNSAILMKKISENGTDVVQLISWK